MCIVLFVVIGDIGLIMCVVKVVGFSYKVVWDVVDMMNNFVGELFVVCLMGGKGGGGMMLMLCVMLLIVVFCMIECEYCCFIEVVSVVVVGFDVDWVLIGWIGMKISVCN